MACVPGGSFVNVATIVTPCAPAFGVIVAVPSSIPWAFFTVAVARAGAWANAAPAVSRSDAQSRLRNMSHLVEDELPGAHSSTRGHANIAYMNADELRALQAPLKLKYKE